jgi:hypothetical protein
VPKPIILEEATLAFESTAPKYQGWCEGSYENTIWAGRGRNLGMHFAALRPRRSSQAHLNKVARQLNDRPRET